MQQPGVFDLALYRGDSYRWLARLWDDAPGGIPVDLTGATAAAEIRDKTAGTHIVELTCTITPPNIVTVQMTAVMWADCPSTGVWDLQLTFAGGEVRTVLRGDVTTTNDVTDSTEPPAVRAVVPQRVPAGRVL